MGIEKDRECHESQFRLSEKRQHRRVGTFFNTECDFDKINSVHVTRSLISRLTADMRVAIFLEHTRKEENDVFEYSDRDINTYSLDFGGETKGGYHVV
jgi:hypothetical protein